MVVVLEATVEVPAVLVETGVSLSCPTHNYRP